MRAWAAVVTMMIASMGWAGELDGPGDRATIPEIAFVDADLGRMVSINPDVLGGSELDAEETVTPAWCWRRRWGCWGGPFWGRPVWGGPVFWYAPVVTPGWCFGPTVYWW